MKTGRAAERIRLGGGTQTSLGPYCLRWIEENFRHVLKHEACNLRKGNFKQYI